MKTGIATTIFLLTVFLTTLLYYLKFVRKEDPVDFIARKSFFITASLTGVVFFGFLLFGFNIVLLFLEFLLLFFLLLTDS